MITVLSSFPDPRPTTNPYITQLARALRETGGIELTTFSWRVALTRRYDVFHAHWPEILVGGREGPKKHVRQLLFVVLLLRFRVHRTAIVRTVHNLDEPDGISLVERVLLRWFDRRTAHRVIINPCTPVPEGRPHSLILHGHYRDWFARYPKRACIPGRFAFVGLIRRYKGTEVLVEAFRVLQDLSLSLSVAGKPSSDRLVTALRVAAGGDPRIAFRFDFLGEADLVDTVTEAEIVTLPYRNMHNSGGVLTALSLDRPVLVPSNESNRRLAEEVGAAWVQTFEGDLDATDLRRALDAVRSDAAMRRGARPDLSARDWSHAGPAHLAAYVQAVETVGGPCARPSALRRSTARSQQ